MHYSEITEKFAPAFFKLTNGAKSICITTHMSADEDAIASILATYRLLTDKYPGKDTQIIHIGEPNKRFQSFQNFDKIQFVQDLSDYLDKFDLLVLLDGSNYHRFTPKPEKIKEFQGKTICIDHHSSPADEFDLALIAPHIPSTAEIIYLLFSKNTPIDKPLAEIFLLGILGDTGNFSYLKPDQGETFITAKRLVEEGNIEIASLQSRYRTLEPKILTALGELIENTSYHKLKDWPDFQTGFLSRSFADKNNLTDREIGEAAEIYTAFFIRQVVGYKWGFSIRPKTSGECSASFRALPESVNVREIAERMGIGGGHDRAAGGTFREGGKTLDARECLERVLDWLEQNKPITS
ncbi:MAG: DHH family phosphoesterase [bacterium]|nr:DHH family phosphoesterase [bacterium]